MTVFSSLIQLSYVLLVLLPLSITSAFVLPTRHVAVAVGKRDGGIRLIGEGRSIVACGVTRLPITMPTTEPMVPYKGPNSEYAQFIGLKSRLLRDRKLWIGNFIDENTSNSIISSLLYLQADAPVDNDIHLYLNIPGALLRPTLAIYDSIQQLKADGCKIHTYNMALCAGMGALIAGAGTKGNRYVMPNARFLLQKTGIDSVFQGQATDIALEVANVKKWNEKISAEISKVTGQPMDRIDRDLKRDFYLSSEEAVRYGICDEVMLPYFGKRMMPPRDVDLGSFASEEGTQQLGSGPSQEEQQQQRPPGGGDDGPAVVKG